MVPRMVLKSETEKMVVGKNTRIMVEKTTPAPSANFVGFFLYIIVFDIKIWSILKTVFNNIPAGMRVMSSIFAR